ncbi:MAG: hypothetical protein AB7S98_12060 [Burkholderiaceae bacterium]
MSTLVSTPSTSERFGVGRTVAVHHRASIAGAALAGLFARWADAWRRRREDAAYETALARDPRLMRDLRMAKSRAEW